MKKEHPEKVPDNYSPDAHKLEYGSNVGAPAIVVPNTSLFKSERGVNASNFFKQKIEELNAEYQKLVQLANDTEIVYNSKYNFIPRVGQTYHLYEINDKLILSMIEPHEWDKKNIGSFKFTADNTWKRV